MGESCEFGRLKVEQLEQEIEEMKNDHNRLEDRFWKIITGGAAMIILQLINLLVILWKKG